MLSADYDRDYSAAYPIHLRKGELGAARACMSFTLFLLDLGAEGTEKFLGLNGPKYTVATSDQKLDDQIKQINRDKSPKEKRLRKMQKIQAAGNTH